MRTYSPAIKKQTQALWRTVGFPASRGPSLVLALRAGLSIDVLESIQKWSSMPKADILRITGIGARNVTRRRSSNGIFTPDESERIARFVRVIDGAVDLFEGNREKAANWMRKPVRGLGYVSPESMLDTESGALEVLDLVGRLEHGVFS